MKRAAFLATAAGAAAVAVVAADRYAREWGVEPGEAAADLPGDDLVPGPDRVMTHGITIDAAPSDVWPWLLQMGYGRGGWYSYDAIDMRGRSHDTIVPELQALAVGDILPTHPDGGFVVRHLEPERALVVYVDSGMGEAWAEAARARREGGAPGDETPANLRAAGGFMERGGLDDFQGSWAWVLSDLGAGRTRLVERFRVRVAGERSPGSRLGMPLVGFGVFVMLRRQMLGLRARAEATARERRFAEAESSAEASAASVALEPDAAAAAAEEAAPGDGGPVPVPA